MHNQAQRVHFVAVHHNVQFHEVGRHKLFKFIVQRSVAARSGFEFVKKVHHHFVHRQVISEHHLPPHILHIALHAAFLVAQGHHVADIILRHENGGGDNRLHNRVDGGDVGQF